MSVIFSEAETEVEAEPAAEDAEPAEAVEPAEDAAGDGGKLRSDLCPFLVQE